jgi:hypothetical protein
MGWRSVVHVRCLAVAERPLLSAGVQQEVGISKDHSLGPGVQVLPVDLRDSVLVLPREVAGDADQAWVLPVDGRRHCLTERVRHEELELRLVIQQPVQIEEALVDDVSVRVSLLLNDDRPTVFI